MRPDPAQPEPEPEPGHPAREAGEPERSSTFSLVIFDCDGVLVDSEPIANRVLREMLEELGLRLTLEDMFEHFVGHSMERDLETLASRFGLVPPPSFAAELYERMGRAMQGELKAVPGVVDVLDRLPLRYCAASNGPHHKMRTTLGITGLLARFEGRLFSAADVARAKPHPDLFLHAARHFEVPPEACAVIEDSPTGVAGGVAAGMTVFGYSAQTPAPRLASAGAHRLFADMRELPRLLGVGSDASGS